MPTLEAYAPHIVVVFGDNSVEHHSYIGRQSIPRWLELKKSKKWQGKKEEKLAYPLLHMIASDKLWVVESMRYFNGLFPNLIEAFQQNGNAGLHMIIPYAADEVHREFLRRRCIKVGKDMSPYWEDLKNCGNERRYRVGSIEKWWDPNGVPAKAFEIDANRFNWIKVTRYLRSLLDAGLRDIQT
jgi:hypothetical protein